METAAIAAVEDVVRSGKGLRRYKELQAAGKLKGNQTILTVVLDVARTQIYPTDVLQDGGGKPLAQLQGKFTPAQMKKAFTTSPNCNSIERSCAVAIAVKAKDSSVVSAVQASLGVMLAQDSKNQELTGENGQLKVENGELKVENGQLKGKVGGLEVKVGELQVKVGGLEEKVVELEGQQPLVHIPQPPPPATTPTWSHNIQSSSLEFAVKNVGGIVTNTLQDIDAKRGAIPLHFSPRMPDRCFLQAVQLVMQQELPQCTGLVVEFGQKKNQLLDFYATYNANMTLHNVHGLFHEHPIADIKIGLAKKYQGQFPAGWETIGEELQMWDTFYESDECAAAIAAALEKNILDKDTFDVTKIQVAAHMLDSLVALPDVELSRHLDFLECLCVEARTDPVENDPDLEDNRTMNAEVSLNPKNQDEFRVTYIKDSVRVHENWKWARRRRLFKVEAEHAETVYGLAAMDLTGPKEMSKQLREAQMPENNGNVPIISFPDLSTILSIEPFKLCAHVGGMSISKTDTPRQMHQTACLTREPLHKAFQLHCPNNVEFGTPCDILSGWYQLLVLMVNAFCGITYDAANQSTVSNDDSYILPGTRQTLGKLVVDYVETECDSNLQTLKHQLNDVSKRHQILSNHCGLKYIGALIPIRDGHHLYTDGVHLRGHTKASFMVETLFTDLLAQCTTLEEFKRRLPDMELPAGAEWVLRE
jgi:hypothetical protein